MTLTVTVDGVDITDKVRLESMRLVMHAVQGQVGTGRIEVDDTTGAADLTPIATEWSVTESDATPTTIAGGFMAEREIRRGPLTSGTQRQFRPVLEDWNTALTDRVLRGSNTTRPAETDYERVDWLIGTGALAMLGGAGQIPNTNTVDMDKTNYRGKTPLDVLDDCMEAAGKNAYIYFDTTWKLYYDKAGATTAAFTSGLRVSDDPADVDSSVTFAPSDVEWTLDPERIYSGIYVRWASGWVWKVKAATQSAYRQLHRTVIKRNMKSAKKARKWAVRQLDKLDEPTKKLSLTVSVPGSALGGLRAGMRIHVKLRARGVTAFTYFRITEVDITPRQGRRGVSDVEYDVKLTMKDKIRPVNLDDDYGGGDSGGGGGTGGGGSGDDSGGGGGGGDATEYVMDDFARAASSGPTSLDTQMSLDTGTTIDLSIPDGANVVGRLLIASIGWDSGDNDLDTEMTTTLGWTRFGTILTNGSYRFGQYYRVTDGTEGWSGTLDTIQITPIASANVVAGFDLLDDWYDDSGPQFVQSSSTTSDPAAVTAGDWSPALATGTAVRYYTALFTDDAGDIDAPPYGFTEIGQAAIGALRISLDARATFVDAIDPDAYDETGNDVLKTFTLGIVGNGGAASPGWGAILEGGGVDTEAPWEGGNLWTTEDSAGTGTFTIAGGSGTMEVTSDATELSAFLLSDTIDQPNDEPWGPWADGDAMFLFVWKSAPLGDITDTDANQVAFKFSSDGWLAIVYVDLGDDVSRSYMAPSQQRGIVIAQKVTETYSSFVAKTLVADTWYKTRIDTRGTRIRVKLWASASAEPVAWDIDVVKVDEPLNVGAAGLYVIYKGNTTGGNMILSLDYIDAALDSGGSGISTLPPGDGTTTTWTIAEWVGQLRVWVDGIETVPASVDRSAGTFTFDRAPAKGAVIRAEYTAA